MAAPREHEGAEPNERDEVVRSDIDFGNLGPRSLDCLWINVWNQRAWRSDKRVLHRLSLPLLGGCVERVARL